ncbi:MAG: U32 family peptidase [Bacteroides sp.]|nr:U32 family peptidase [Bacteroides sp.]MCM1550594.1 U32 family peptidase [Clostridium sp.]
MGEKLPEILAPAGSLTIMKQAFQAGADAVYLGGQLFGARAYAVNLTEEELLQGIEYVQLHHKKLYLTVNTLLKNEDIDRLFEFLEKPYEAGLDGVIVQDLGVARMLRRGFPDLELHASTQMSVTSPYGVALLKEFGFSRVVPARELSMEEIHMLKKETDLEVEVFVHGALCYSYSGQCLLSSMIGGRSGNRGRCAQPCRQRYTTENGDSGYLLSPRDLCSLRVVPELIRAGVDSFKIEGRMKKPEYVIAAVNAYRRAIDAYEGQKDFDLQAEQEQLADIYNRGNFTEGYFYQHNGPDMMAMKRNHHNGIFLGTIRQIKGNQLLIPLERELNRGDVLEVRTTTGEAIELTSGQEGNKGQVIAINGRQLKKLQVGDPVYRTKNHTLCQRLLEENDENRLKEKINFSVTLKKDLSARIIADCGERQVVVTGSVVKKAQNQPVSEEMLLTKLQKLGDTSFLPGDIVIDMEKDCFISMKEWNQLRRQAVTELEQLCSQTRRRAPTDISKKLSGSQILEQSPARKKPVWAVGVSTREQSEVVWRTDGVSRMDVELECFSLTEAEELLNQTRSSGKKGYLSLPRSFRRNMADSLLPYLDLQADGYVVRTLDELEFIRCHRPEASVICDYSVYAYNREAAASYRQWDSIHALTLPVELNKKELQELLQSTEGIPWEWILYGRQPVMLSAQCVTNNTEGCRGNSGYTVLKNSFQDEFLVHRICKYCYNVIYQKEPVCLLSFLPEWQPLCQTYRIMLTTESGAETEGILNPYGTVSGISGHYKKGIE